MADLYRERRANHSRNTPSLTARAVKIAFFVLLLAIVAGASWLILQNKDIPLLQKEEATTGYLLIEKQIVPESNRPDPVNKTPMGYPRRVIQPTQYLLTCRSIPGNQTVTFSVDRLTYEGLPLRTQFAPADVAHWNRIEPLAPTHEPQ